MSNGVDSAAVEALEPAAVWRLFAGISAVPHPSKKEQRIRAHMRAVSEEMGFWRGRGPCRQHGDLRAGHSGL